jgi:hypothetical protein
MRSPLEQFSSVYWIWAKSGLHIHLLRWLRQKLFEPIDIASLVYFRVAFGAIMLWEVYRYFSKGWISRYWIDPILNFTYYGFDWVRPLPGIGMYVVFGLLGLLSILIILGAWYRLSAILFFVGFTYTFLLEQARYLNHFYLVCLISFLMIFLPVHRAWSMDALRYPAISAQVAPTWTLWLLRAQLGIVYFYAGIAKLNADWFRGEPLRSWLAARTDFPIIGILFNDEWMVYLLSYGGLLLDLLVVPFLLWRRTRVIAFGFALAFHLMNARLFSIGIFPWFMIAATVLFFPPDFPRWILGGIQGNSAPAQISRVSPLHLRQSAILTGLGIYLTWQLVFPFRHFLYPGNVNWSYEGHQYSWHMKLLSKRTKVEYVLNDPHTQTSWTVTPEDYLARWQARKIGSRPDLILQFAHFLADDAWRQGYQTVEVRANVLMSLNGRGYQPFIDPAVNLATERRTIAPKSWILPLSDSAETSKSSENQEIELQDEIEAE